jgi:uncharacterized membrane protein
MSTPDKQLIEWIETGAIPKDKIEHALTVIKVTPDGKSWVNMLDRLLLWLGALALAFSVLFFIAYNWNDLGRFAKFGMVESLIMLAIIVYCKLAPTAITSKVSLLVATILLGVLLALYGQTYQTGADPWQLFFYWALLMLPWAVIGRFPTLWIVWIALINLSIILYFMTFRGIFDLVFSSEPNMLWIIFVFNTLAFIVWQLLATKWEWLRERWAIRLLAVSSGVPLTWLTLYSIFDSLDMNIAQGVWVFWLATMLYVYRKLKIDLFILAGCCLSTITITVSLLGKPMLYHSNPGAFLFLAFIVIGMGSGSALWLKNIHRESVS